MDWLERAWGYLSGKKVIIGSILLWLGHTGLPHLVSQGFDPVWMSHAISLFIWLGQILIPVGVIHKAAKAKKK